MIGLIIFGIVLTVFLILYFKKGFYEALVISSIVATIGVLFIPDMPLWSFYIRLFGKWQYVVISFNEMKIIIIVAMVIFTIYLRENRHKFKGVIS